MNPFKTQYIIEGCDCTGKSSLISSLLKIFEENKVYSPVVKFSAPVDACQYERVAKDWVRMCENMVEPVIFDRFIFSEGVYGPLYRKTFPMYLRDLELEIPRSVILVLVEAKLEIIKKRFDGEFIDEEDIEEILKRYRMQFTASNIKNKILVNTSDLTPDQAARDLLMKVRKL